MSKFFQSRWLDIRQKSNLNTDVTAFQQFRGFGNEWNPSPMDVDVSDSTNLSFHLPEMIADHCRNLGRVGKIETLLILPICPRSFQAIGDIYNCEFSLVHPDHLGAFYSTKITGLNFRWSNGTRPTASQNSRSHALQHRACWVKLCCV